MNYALFTVTMTAALDAADGPDLISLLEVLGARLAQWSFLDAAITASKTDVSFTAQIEAFDISAVATMAAAVVSPLRVLHLEIDKEPAMMVAEAVA